MLKHIVLMKWKQGTEQAAVDAVGQGFAKLRDEIPQIRRYEFGPDAGIYRGNADYALVAEFESEQDLKDYSVHSAHQRFLKEVTGPILHSFQSAQFEA